MAGRHALSCLGCLPQGKEHAKLAAAVMQLNAYADDSDVNSIMATTYWGDGDLKAAKDFCGTLSAFNSHRSKVSQMRRGASCACAHTLETKPYALSSRARAGTGGACKAHWRRRVPSVMILHSILVHSEGSCLRKDPFLSIRVLSKCPWIRLRTDWCLCVQVMERVAALRTTNASRRAPSSWMCLLLPSTGCSLTGIKAGGLGNSSSGGLQEVTLLSPSLHDGTRTAGTLVHLCSLCYASCGW